MLIVISPAKTLDFDTPAITNEFSQPEYLDHSSLLIEQLKQFSDNEVASLMKLSDKLAGLNLSRYQAWQLPFTSENAKQAVLAFKGDVYTGLDAVSMDHNQLDFCQQHLRILSGLYGILKPLDLIQPYRLEMGTRLLNDRGKDLYAFWGELLSEAIQTEAEQTGGVLINLASNEYFKAVKEKKLQCRIITPIFKDWKNDRYKIISFYAKKARGLMSRYIIDHAIETPEEIQEFTTAGYQFNEGLSKGDDWVFTRKI